MAGAPVSSLLLLMRPCEKVCGKISQCVRRTQARTDSDRRRRDRNVKGAPHEWRWRGDFSNIRPRGADLSQLPGCDIPSSDYHAHRPRLCTLALSSSSKHGASQCFPRTTRRPIVRPALINTNIASLSLVRYNRLSFAGMLAGASWAVCGMGMGCGSANLGIT